MHKQISIKDLCFTYSKDIIFEDFTTQINLNDRIAIIGSNGCGKSTLIKILQQKINLSSGTITFDADLKFGYVPQLIDDFNNLSGGERFNKVITRELSSSPDVLLLDEPTNHLDLHNRKSLMRMLNSYFGTLIIVSHDQELLSSCVNVLWHITEKKINIFKGNYNDYIQANDAKRNLIEKELYELDKQKRDIHLSLMKEQQRASKSKRKGQKSIRNKKWPTVVSKAKFSRAQKTSGDKKATINSKKNKIKDKLDSIYLPEIIAPTFAIASTKITDNQLVYINDGAVCYLENKIIIQSINLSISGKDRIAIKGDNGSGKTIFIKAILNMPDVIKSGNWHMPKQECIGYLDQHYNSLIFEQTVFDSISKLMPEWSCDQSRNHLNSFLFRNNEEVNMKVTNLSGGEKARLSLALIAAKTPSMLILDEITNNLDIETTNHVIQVLKNYPGAILAISHDDNFLREINIKNSYEIVNKELINSYLEIT